MVVRISQAVDARESFFSYSVSPFINCFYRENNALNFSSCYTSPHLQPIGHEYKNR